MKSSGNYWIWPEEDDISCENLNAIVRNVSPPVLKNNRGQFNFFFGILYTGCQRDH